MKRIKFTKFYHKNLKNIITERNNKLIKSKIGFKNKLKIYNLLKIIFYFVTPT